MNRYQVILTDELDEVYRTIAEELSMSVEQTLAAALQLYAEKLTLNSYDGICNTEPVRRYEDNRSRAAR